MDDMSNHQEKEIYSGIYGGWKKTDVQTLKTVRCAMFPKCSLYAKGKCACIPVFLSPSCPFGKSHSVRGYSERAARYYEWQRDIKARESYRKLEPITSYVAKVGDYIVTDLYCGIYWEEKENKWKGPSLGTTISKILISDLTPERLYELYKYIPYTIFDHMPVKGYKENRDKWFSKLNETIPELVKELIKLYPDIEIDSSHVGRTALLKTLVDGTIVKDYKGVKWTFNKSEMKITSKEYKCQYFSGLFDDENVTMTVECNVTDKMKIDVLSDEWVDSETVYVD